MLHPPPDTTPRRLPRHRRRFLAALVAAAAAAAAVAVAMALSLSASSSSSPLLPTTPPLPSSSPSSWRRRLAATLEGSLAFNMGQASTTAKFKTVPKGKAAAGRKVVSKQAAGEETRGAGGGAGVDGACAPSRSTFNLSRAEAGELGRALLGLAATGNKTATVQVKSLFLRVGG